MRILAVVQGNFGTRKVANIRSHGPADWTIEVFTPPGSLPQIIDDPEEFLPADLPQADLLLYLCESPSVFPKPFCTLTEDSYGYRRSAKHYDNELIASFAQHFGKPELKITVNPETRKIEAVDVIRDATCGSARHVAQGLVGVSADEAEFEAGMLHHHYPCLAAMVQEQIDDRLVDTLMHVAGFIIRDEVGEQVKPFKKPVPYVTTESYVSGKEDSPGS